MPTHYSAREDQLNYYGHVKLLHLQYLQQLRCIRLYVTICINKDLTNLTLSHFVDNIYKDYVNHFGLKTKVMLLLELIEGLNHSSLLIMSSDCCLHQVIYS